MNGLFMNSIGVSPLFHPVTPPRIKRNKQHAAITGIMHDIHRTDLFLEYHHSVRGTTPSMVMTFSFANKPKKKTIAAAIPHFKELDSRTLTNISHNPPKAPIAATISSRP